MRMNNRYDEIMELPHHVSKTRPQMPLSDRAAQFAPFAALTGYDSAIKETGRLTDERIELDEEALTALDRKYQLLMDTLDDAPEVTIIYFQPDERKAGGQYVSATGTVKKVDTLAGESSCRTAQGFRWTASMTCAFSFGNHGAVVKDPHNWKMAEMRFRISAIQRVKKPRRVCRPQTAKKYNHFLSRHVRERKYFSGCQCGICPS